MKLSELHEAKGWSTQQETTIEGWDRLEPAEGLIEPFNVVVEFKAEQDSTSHPYGDGQATENHGTTVELISAKTAEEVKLLHVDTDEVLKTFPKGTDVTSLPGWKQEYWKHLQGLVEHDVDGMNKD